MREIRTSTITSKGQIVIPSSIREHEGFRSGQKVAVFAFGDRIEIRPLGYVLERLDLKAEREKSRAFLKKFAEKHKLKGTKIRRLSAREREELARGLL